MRTKKTEKPSLDDVLEWLVAEMQKKLEENAHKSGWDDVDLDYALDRMREEVEELAPLIAGWDYRSEQAEEIVRECSDVANFCFMLALKVRGWRLEAVVREVGRG